MKDLSAGVLAQLDANELEPITLFRLHVTDADVRYYTSYDSDVVFAGKTYSAYPIYFDNVTVSVEEAIDSIRITVGNADRVFTDLCETYDGLVRKRLEVITTFVGMTLAADSVIEFDGYISRATFPNAEQCVFEVTNILHLGDIRVPLRSFSQCYCTWDFKDPETCKYSGATTSCDKYYKTCISLNNFQNFGGFLLIPREKIFTV